MMASKKWRTCKACGNEFVPASYMQRGARYRLYCYRPQCEEVRAKKIEEERIRRKLQTKPSNSATSRDWLIVGLLILVFLLLLVGLLVVGQGE